MLKDSLLTPEVERLREFFRTYRIPDYKAIWSFTDAETDRLFEEFRGEDGEVVFDILRSEASAPKAPVILIVVLTVLYGAAHKGSPSAKTMNRRMKRLFDVMAIHHSRHCI